MSIKKQMFGASFSAPYARHLELDPKEVLDACVNDLGVRRLRLMSYWNQIEPDRDNYDFTDLDWQIELAQKTSTEVTLCLGLRQPRWPESHWPKWAKGLPEQEWQKALLTFIKVVVNRYKSYGCIVSYQLENEALLKSFGENGNYDRPRLKREFKLIKQLDPKRPIIMTTSDSWGIPVLGPKPDQYGFSLYRYFYDRGSYRHSARPPLFYRIRALLIRCIRFRRTFIHELQAEPWGPAVIPDMTIDEQFKSIDFRRVKEAVEFARATKLYPIDIWGMEWWYYLKTRHRIIDIWEYMRSVYK